jgi:hypothetical protein
VRNLPSERLEAKRTHVREAKITIVALLCLFAAPAAGSARQLKEPCEAHSSPQQRSVLKTYPRNPKRCQRARLINPFETEWDLEKWEKALRANEDKN